MSVDLEFLTDLVCRARAGDQEAARLAFERCAELVSQMVRRHLRPEVRPAYGDSDVVQLVLVDLFTGELPSDVFSSLGRLLGYLTSMARNKIHQLHRQELGTRKRRRDRVVALDDVVPDGSPGPDVVAAAEDEWRELQGRLPRLWRRVLALLRQGYSREETGQLVGVSTSTVDRMVFAARRIVAVGSPCRS